MNNCRQAPVVRVGFPTAIPGLYDYAVPPHLRPHLYRGVAVRVPLRSKELWGVVIACTDTSDVSSLKEILEVHPQGDPQDMEALVSLYEWLASYYKCDIGRLFRPFVRKKLIETRPRRACRYHVAAQPPAGGDITPTQHAYTRCLHAHFSSWFCAADAQTHCGVSYDMLQRLCQKGLVHKEHTELATEVSAYRVHEDPISLSASQRAIVDAVVSDFDSPERPFLLHGITGSGKTFIYIELTKEMLARGKSVCILVPEISLTPQTIHRFETAVGSDTVALIHSRMSAGQRKETLHRLVTGEKKVLVGARSAVLAPLCNPGLLIVDEEHDASYKQTEAPPRYHARDVAVMRARYQHCSVVLGSATPSIESYYNALQGKYRLCELHERFAGAVLPGVTIVDMNKEHQENNWTILSRELASRIEDTLARDKQVILLLNRRGFSVCLICKDCGYTYRCPHCCVTLTYHRSDLTLKCHQCGYIAQAPDTCAQCHGTHIKYKGTGIQKACEFIQQQFPAARIIRMDQDTTRRKGAFASLLMRFAHREADILIGTQMVAKGLDFPGVGLVGVLQADTALHIPDFRAAERTFHLLTQVSGRAGRKDNAGSVIIQTYFPGEPAIQFAQQHDFIGFYKEELQQRAQLCYPPYGRLARILATGKTQHTVQAALDTIAATCKTHAQRLDCYVLGPSPAVLEKLRDIYRYSLIVKSSSPARLHRLLHLARPDIARVCRNVHIVIDIDPINLL